MSAPSLSSAWLQSSAGAQLALAGNCSLGRSSDNTIQVAGTHASRRHAIIHAQEGGEFWLVDLGSSNGTFLNSRRVGRPVRLRDGDRISISETQFVFHQAAPAAPARQIESQSEPTMVDIRNEWCWLLVADLEDYTSLSQQVSPDQLAEVVGRWVRTCKEAIERHGGTINKYLGDGFMAYWLANPPAQVAAALAELQGTHAAGGVRFRIVVHHGRVALGGGATMGEESLMGQEVNFVFRLEKLAGSLGVAFCFSDAAARHLGSLVAAVEVPGGHELKGFTGKHRVYAL